MPTLQMPPNPVEAPVPDPAALGPDEDLEREPDGAPHRVIGWTAFTIVAFALVIGALLAGAGAAALVITLVLVAFAAPIAIVTLYRASAQRRDLRHPSR